MGTWLETSKTHNTISKTKEATSNKQHDAKKALSDTHAFYNYKQMLEGLS
jgi:hypothetical protein